MLAGEWPVLFLWPLALAYLFPDGRLPGPRWRIPWRITLVAATGVLGLLPFARHLSEPFDDVPSPMPVTFEGSFGLTVFWICWAGLLGGLFAGAAAVWWRKRRSTGERRLQMLWLSYGAFLVPLWLSSGWIIGLFGSDADDVGFVWLLLLYVWLAVAVGVAVTRHGLYGIERLINRTLVYGALTVALAAAYGIVVLVAGVVFGGSSACARRSPRWSWRSRSARCAGGCRRSWTGASHGRATRAPGGCGRSSTRSGPGTRSRRTSPTEIAAALRDPTAEVVYLLPASGAWADRRGHTLDAVPDDGRARTPIGRDHRQVGVLLHDPDLLAKADLLHGVLDAAAVASRSRACASRCACSSRRSSRRARGSCRRGWRSAAGWSATCTTARSSAS